VIVFHSNKNVTQGGGHMTSAQLLEMEALSGAVKLSKATTSPGGRHFRAVVVGKNLMIMDAQKNDGNTIIVEGGGTTSIALIGGIVDAIGEAILAVIKIMTCHMKTTTTVTCDKNGVVQKIETTTECVPG
jgi:hypothetical protein